MGVETNIGWTHHTFNMWRSCVEVAPECANCYARELAKQNPKILGKWGKDGTRVVGAESYWYQPIRWNAAAKAAGECRRVFCASLADVFEDWQGPMLDIRGNTIHIAEHGEFSSFARPAKMQDIRNRLFALIDATPWLDWLLLTKRPENIVRMVPAYFPGGYIAEAGSMNQEGRRPNLWLGTSAGTQATADAKIPWLFDARGLAQVLFVSAEPLLSPIVFPTEFESSICDCKESGTEHRPGCLYHGKRAHERLWMYDGIHCLDWIIVGGESGPKRRDCGVDAIIDVARQCQAAGVPCYVKQDCAREDGQQGRIPDSVWAIKEYPNHAAN